MTSISPELSTDRIARPTAQQIVRDLRRYEDTHEFTNTRARTKFIASHSEVATPFDVCTINVLADAVPETALTAETVFDCEDLHELIIQCFNAYKGTLAIAECFQTLDVEPSRHAVTIERPNFDVRWDSAPSEPGYEDVAVEATKWAASTVIADQVQDSPSIPDTLSSLITKQFTSIARELELNTVDVTDPRPIRTAFDTLDGSAYTPDIACIDETLLEDNKLPDHVSRRIKTIGSACGCPVHTSERLSRSKTDVLLVDTDHVGYDVRFEPVEVLLSDTQYRKPQTLSPRPLQATVTSRTTHTVLEPDAYIRAQC